MASDRKSTLKLGIILLVMSTVLWLVPLLVPFLELSGKGKVVLTALLLIAAEILFWAGVFFAGKEAAQKFRGRLNPKKWFKGKKEKDKDL
ncbi:transporter suffix domain-containing protein [Peribacillus sp. SCS-37]|uniref:transporter suffix domain-containing protein n=1 Tax=Paraperibacillus esterisolvens TaxID=3115296 RepID=UPI003906A445